MEQGGDRTTGRSELTVWGDVCAIRIILAFTFGMSGTRFEKVSNVVERKLMILVRQFCGQTFMLIACRNAFRADFKDYLEAVIGFMKMLRI